MHHMTPLTRLIFALFLLVNQIPVAWAQPVMFEPGLSRSQAEAVAEGLGSTLQKMFRSHVDDALRNDRHHGDYNIEFTIKFEAADARLGDGREDAVFVRVDSPGWCGSGGCTTHFLFSDGRWKEIGEDFGGCKYVALDSRSKGLRDVLKIPCKYGDASRVLRFNGVKYVAGGWPALHDAEMLKWIRMIAEHNATDAQIKLGSMYEAGVRGVQQDHVQAYVWFNIAKIHALDGRLRAAAEEQLKHVANKLTSEQIDEAQRLARDWQPYDSAKKGRNEFENRDRESVASKQYGSEVAADPFTYEERTHNGLTYLVERRKFGR
jgi:TPR repeat protein